MRKKAETGVFRITGAPRGLAEDVRGRQRRYVISMSVRTLSVVLTAVLWNVERHVAVVTLVLGMLLPYVAVVIANGGRENAVRLPSAHLSPPVRPLLEGRPGSVPAEPGPESRGAARSDRPGGEAGGAA
ncbi:DUF3099 domain-containing protein [Streptomyces zingiberis]|uniref:DUF3099 domain-containing protein n=1 Tax=Streptomyces zingiberis TaxID=2053010 RepID=A0ABX1C572_9ACTN|nr:DUF3099 domain-containing protein [Streptomyces zingiberis]NJQ02089.1 DUF3099 domain-containing protein [Streptomyces zingiberis]